PVYEVFISKSIQQLCNKKDNIFEFKDKSFAKRVQSIILDLPAKAAVLQTKQFNGEFGCLNCYHPGEWSNILHK
ncbi:unnamed protein product, partial [Brachionus calyciflorus]